MLLPLARETGLSINSPDQIWSKLYLVAIFNEITCFRIYFHALKQKSSSIMFINIMFSW